MWCLLCFCKAEDGIRDAQESRGLGDVYKRQELEQSIAKLKGVKARIEEMQGLAEKELERVAGLTKKDATDELFKKIEHAL